MNKISIIIPVILIVIIAGFLIFAIQQSIPSDEESFTEVIPLVIPEETMPKKELTIGLLEQNDSEESGIATLTEIEGQTRVLIEITQGIADIAQPAHIHEGSCTELGGVNYPLTNILDGSSETMVEVSFDQLIEELPLAINVHKSGPQIDVYVACGDFPANLMMDMEGGEAMMEQGTILAMSMEDEDGQTATLTTVDGSISSGTAYLLIKNGIMYHAVIAAMSDPTEGNVYEGWLVQMPPPDSKAPVRFISTGVLKKNELGMWQLEYTTDNSAFFSYTDVIITEETVVDGTPEVHILEGSF